LEPSGGYERGIIRALLAAGLSVRRINPNKLRQFARARGVLAKNDRLDARLIAEIAEYVAIMPTRVVQRDAAVERLAEIVTMRRQLCDEHVAAENQAAHLEDAMLRRVEPMAAITAPGRTAAQHQSLLHFMGEGRWSDEKVLAQVRGLVLPELKRHGPIEAWIIDDTSFPKKGQHSVGVARQYCGELGKQDNCQVAVTLSIANHDASLPVAYRLYLPKEWASDRKRRRKVGVPDEISFKTKPEIALAQIRWACEAGLPRGAVLMDAGYGVDTDLRTSIAALGLSYVAGI